MTENAEKIFTVKELAGDLGLHPLSILRWIHAPNGLVAIKVGRSYKISQSAITAYLVERTLRRAAP